MQIVYNLYDFWSLESFQMFLIYILFILPVCLQLNIMCTASVLYSALHYYAILFLPCVKLINFLMLIFYYMYFIFLCTEHISCIYKDGDKDKNSMKNLYVDILKNSADRWFVNFNARLLKWSQSELCALYKM